jgi:DNA topoisomerase-1
MILAGIGRYGPYLQMGKMYANLPGIEDVFEIQMNRAVTVIDETKAGGGKGRFGRAAPTPIKELGESPVTGKAVRVLNGRYGPYINDGETNANAPKDKKPEDVTLDEALALLAARVEAGGGKKRRAAKKAAPKKAAAKKTAAKKPTAKKAATKTVAKKAAPRKGAKA